MLIKVAVSEVALVGLIKSEMKELEYMRIKMLFYGIRYVQKIDFTTGDSKMHYMH